VIPRKDADMRDQTFKNSSIKIAVLAGGIGEERDISLQSGENIASALKAANFNVILSDITPDNTAILGDASIDIFFIALHGAFGEDGKLQKILEQKNLTYTGSNAKASELAFDKIRSKNAFINAGIATPPFIEIKISADLDCLEQKLNLLNAEKFVIKPANQGSSVGITITDRTDLALAAANACLNDFGDSIIEKFIPGKEITVGIIGNRPLPIIEIVSNNGFYDYNSKYIDQSTKYLFDTITDRQLIKNINSQTVKCFNILGCEQFARIDFIISNDNLPYALEVNTIPGFTSHSLLPKAAQNAGISQPQLCETIVHLALKKNYEKLESLR